MALEFNTKLKGEQQFREEMRILATQIETINQQLSTSSGGGPASAKAFADLNAKLSFLYEILRTLQTDLRSQTKESFEHVQTSVNTTLQKNLGDLYALQQDTQKQIQNIKVTGGAGGSQDITDIKQTMKDLVKVYREEVDIFKKQNAFLQEKLVQIEQRLNELEK